MSSVLVVDDDGALRAATLRLLRTLGHDAIAVESGEEALLLLSTESTESTESTQRFELVITDYQMAAVSGLEVVAQACALSPPVPCILVSGGLVGDVQERAQALGVFRVLEKPFSFAALASAVGDALAQR